MPKPSQDSQADGVSIITAGMNSGVAPRLVTPGQLAFAINVTNRGGMPRTRPVWVKVGLEYDTETQIAATQALFQGAHFYQAVGQGENCLVASIGGRLFRYLVGSSGIVQDITPADGDANDPNNPNCWMWQAEDFLIVQNGSALPWFFDGAGTRRSQGQAGKELPAGCMGVYVQGRNWMTLPNRRSFMAGDLVYSHGFLGPYGGRDAVLKTEENEFLSGGGAFGLPITAGPINAMSSVAIADTSLGQGPLQIMTQNSVFSVQTPVLREDWAEAQYALMTVGLPNYGALSQTGVVTVNGDLWYRSADGLRSYQIGRRDLNTWVNTPQSVEMEAVLMRDVDRLLNKATGVLFDNRLLISCSPRRVTGRGTAHWGLVALDFNNISNLTSRATPAYDGLWTGLRVLQLVKGVFAGVERCFAFALDTNNGICLYELMSDGVGYFDNNGLVDVATQCSIETRSMGWKDGGNALKELQAADLYVDRLAGPGNGTVGLNFRYRSDEDPVYQAWHAFTLCAPVRDCSTGGCLTFQNVREQYRTYLRLPTPAETCSQITRRRLRTGYEFQVRMAWAGFLQLNRLHVWARAMVDSVVTACPTSETCVLLTGCDVPWFGYDIDGGGGGEGEFVGIVEEDEDTWITTEGGVVIRTEDQPQFP